MPTIAMQEARREEERLAVIRQQAQDQEDDERRRLDGGVARHKVCGDMLIEAMYHF